MNQIDLTYNLPQIAFAITKTKTTILEWGRGTGKSTAIGKRLKDCTDNLPRAKFAMPGETYKQLLLQTLPSTIKSLEMLGQKKDLHYFVGKKPPEKWRWKTAYEPPLSYETSFIWPNGFTAQMLSMESDTGRGINFDGSISDETGSLDAVRLGNNVLGSIRGNEKYFRNHWLHQSKLFVGTTALTLKGRWFSDLADLAIKDPKNIRHIKATSYMNAHNLGKEYFKTMLRQLTTLQFNAEILCKRPDRIDNGFYPNFLEEKHTYDASNINYLFGSLEGSTDGPIDNCKSDNDLREDLPIDIACDWGATINTMSCGQDHALGNEYRFINAFHVLSPQTIHDLANKFCDYYENKIRKDIHFYYDHTAVFKGGSGTPNYADTLTDALTKRGWTVNKIYCGQAPGHAVKYNFWVTAHREDGTTRLPAFRYNKSNCKFLIVSIQQAGAFEGKNGIEKDKRPERRLGQRQEEATHHSDGHDTLGFFKFKHRISTMGWVF